ncbi:MAG: DUF4469 domain-containing protein [Candidatus Electronema sp. V4]|uniref:DUF4469 domain-containing protein n=1 Tax=Candidatus Electronema sp. V4 TaxID=3454756 RepID=UPI0040554F7F
MQGIHYRVERNPLTKPASYRLRFIPQGTAGYDEVAARVALKNPGSSAEQIRNHLRSAMEEIQAMLLEGLQVTLEETMIFRPAFTARLASPDAPLPPMEELLGINISASQPFVKDVQAAATLVREPWTEKIPAIQAAADTTTGLNNVLNPAGVLRLTGSNLAFDWQSPNNGCVLAGTESGSAAQTQFASISDSEILLVPHIPAQAHPWNNEYTVAITTQYTEHGSVRTGAYSGRLRAPLTVDKLSHPHPQETGILTGSAVAPYVVVTAGNLTADTRLRVQVEHNVQDDILAFKLIDMQDGGAAGMIVPATGNGEFVLPGFSGSAVSSLSIKVDNYAALKTMVVNEYDGRLVDVLDVKMG